MELPLLTGDIQEHIRFTHCGQTYRCICEDCGTVYRSDVWHGCDAGLTRIMNRNEASYQAYRAKLGTRDNWTGD